MRDARCDEPIGMAALHVWVHHNQEGISRMSASSRTTLLLLRVGLFLFMMIWAVEKFVRPEAFQNIFGSFYGFDAGNAVIYAFGAVQVVILLLFVAGACKTISYALVMAMNLITLLVSYRQLLAPFEGGNHLFAASIVVAAASVGLFLARQEDTLLVIDSKDELVTAEPV